jgi:hypothetical protein
MSEIKDRLKELPLRAVVAFAARCARRVQPLTSSSPWSRRDAVDRALQGAEGFALGGGYRATERATLLDAADRADDDYADTTDRAVLAATHAADAAIHAADAADRAANADATDRAASFAADADALATRAAGFAANAALAAYDAALAAYDADLDRLAALNLGQPGTLGSAIDPSEEGPLGPLWPNGAPDWYLNPTKPGMEDQPEESTAPPITFYFDTAEFSDREIADILVRLSDLYRAIGGDALVIDRTETLDPSLVLTPEEV